MNKKEFLNILVWLKEEIQVSVGTWLVWLGLKVLRGFIPEVTRHERVSDKRKLDILRAMFKQDIASGNVELNVDIILKLRESVRLLNASNRFLPPLCEDELFTLYIEVIQEIRTEQYIFHKLQEKGV